MAEPTLLYRFNDSSAYRLLASQSSVPSEAASSVVGSGTDAALRIKVSVDGGATLEPVAAIGLPALAIHGDPEIWRLDLRGDSSRCRVVLEIVDGRDNGGGYTFPVIDFTGRRVLEAPVASPQERWGELHTKEIQPPLHPIRLCIAASDRNRNIDLSLFALRVTGAVRLASAGIA